jgi:transcriptional regulator with XRE-family HTH domain
LAAWSSPKAVNDVLNIDKKYEKYLGPFIRDLRVEIGVTQQQLSSEIGFSVQTISKFENGGSSISKISSRYIVDYILQESGLSMEEVLREFMSYCEYLENGNTGVKLVQ